MHHSSDISYFAYESPGRETSVCQMLFNRRTFCEIAGLLIKVPTFEITILIFIKFISSFRFCAVRSTTNLFSIYFNGSCLNQLYAIKSGVLCFVAICDIS